MPVLAAIAYVEDSPVGETTLSCTPTAVLFPNGQTYILQLMTRFIIVVSQKLANCSYVILSHNYNIILAEINKKCNDSLEGWRPLS